MTVTLKIEKNVYGGDGMGRLGDGRVCFVPGVFAGETVKAEIVEQKKRYVKAKLVELVVELSWVSHTARKMCEAVIDRYMPEKDPGRGSKKQEQE